MNTIRFLNGRAFDVAAFRRHDGRWYVSVEHVGAYGHRHGIARSASEAEVLAQNAMAELCVLLA